MSLFVSLECACGLCYAFHSALCVAACAFSPIQDGLQQLGGCCDGRFLTGIMSDTSKLERVLKFLEVPGSVFFLREGGFSPQTSARQILYVEDRRSTIGEALLCAAAVKTWSHDAFVSKHLKLKKSQILALEMKKHGTDV